MHAGYVEDSYALQRHAAQVQSLPTALVEAKQQVVYAMEQQQDLKHEQLCKLQIITFGTTATRLH